jgi:hypothetical protein
MAYTRTEWNNLQKRIPPEDRTSYEEYLATQPKKKPAPTSGTISGFTPTVAMPEPKKQPGDAGFVGPVAKTSTASTTDSAASVGPSGGLAAGVVAGVTGPAASVSTSTPKGSSAEKPVWKKAGVVNTLGGPVDVNAEGVAQDGSVPVAVSEPFTDKKIEPVKFTATDGTVFTDKATYEKYQELLNDKQTISDTTRRAGESAYNILYKTFSEYGLGSLVESLQSYIKDGLSEDELTLRLRETPAYQKRFGANKQRIAKGLAALSEAEYIKMEDQYQEVMRQYGLPESYWSKDPMGTQAGFEQLLANDVSNTELEDRLLVAQDRVLKANPEVLSALKQFYPGIKNGDILAYTLDPKNAIKDIQRKVTAAEIGGAALAQGLNQGQTPEEIQRYAARAEQLAGAGVTKAAAQQGFETVAGMAPRGSQLASIYGEDPYTQQTAESEIFNLAGSAEAKKKREKLTALETASFSGQAGRGVLARERAGSI